MKAVGLMVAMLVLALGLVSCRDKVEDRYRTEVARAEQMAMEGNPTGAIQVLAAIVDVEAFKGYKAEVLNRMVHLAWMAGDADRARKFFQTGVEVSPAAMEGSLSIMVANLSGRQTGEEFVGWCESMDEVKFGASGRGFLTVAHLQALCGLGRAKDGLRVAESAMRKVETPAALDLARRVFDVLSDAGCRSEAGEIPALVERVVPASAERKGLLCDLRLVLLAREGRVDDALRLFREEIPGIPDGNVIGGLNLLSGYLQDKGDALSEEIMTSCALRSGVREAAARHWMRMVRDRKDIPGMGGRLVSLRERGFADGFIAGQMDAMYSEFLGAGDAKVMAPVYGMFDVMMKESQDLNFKKRVAGYLLDMGFFLEKYAESLALVESDLFKEDERVMTGVLAAKIKAHLALQQGRVDEAVLHFREFMGLISKQMVEREMDPLDGTWVTGDMVMGLNSRRIGDILAKAGRAEEAAKAYGEARAYYEKAMLAFPDKESRENRKIQASLDAIPGK